MKKRTAGRAKSTAKRVKFTTTLPEAVIEKLRMYGDGNASEGICYLVEKQIPVDGELRTASNGHHMFDAKRNVWRRVPSFTVED